MTNAHERDPRAQEGTNVRFHHLQTARKWLDKARHRFVLFDFDLTRIDLDDVQMDLQYGRD